MILWFLPELGDWLAARAIDSALVGEQMPGWAPLAGLVFAAAGTAVLTAMAVRAWDRRRLETAGPLPESLTAARPWLAEESIETMEIPTRSHRAPGPRSRLVTHEELRSRASLPAGEDATETAVLHLNQPRERSGRRG